MSESFEVKDIMEAILKLPGPVATPRAVKATRRCFLHNLLTNNFIEAAEELEKANLGKVVTLQNKGGIPLKIFLKKPPVEAQQVLGVNPDLCQFEMYSMQYAKGSPKSIAFPLRARLVAMKLVAQDHFM